VLYGDIALQEKSDEINTLHRILYDLVAQYTRRLFESRGSETSVLERIYDPKNPNQIWEVVFHHPQRTVVMDISFISDGVLVMESRGRDLVVIGTVYRAVTLIHQNLQLLFDGLQELVPELRTHLEDYVEIGKARTKKRPSSR
jgi:hypothetical protein